MAVCLTAGGTVAQDGNGASLAGSEWVPTGIVDVALPEHHNMFLQFRGEGRLAGNSGCNRFSGTWTTGGDRISLNAGAMTRMACPPDVMALERGFMDALAAITGWERDGIALSLTGADGSEVIRLRQTDWD